MGEPEQLNKTLEPEPLEKNEEPEPLEKNEELEPLEKKRGAGAGKKLAGSLALIYWNLCPGDSRVLINKKMLSCSEFQNSLP